MDINNYTEKQLFYCNYLEEEDIVDSDFDQSTEGEDEDEEAAEKQILAEEKLEKKKVNFCTV